MTTQPHPEPSEEASSLPVVGYAIRDSDQFIWTPPVSRPFAKAWRAVVYESDAQSQLNAMRVERDAALVLAASHSNECEKWAAMHQRSKAEIAALKAVDVDRIMVLADKYAYATKVAEEEGSCQADYDECNAAREALRASLASPEGSPR